MPDSPAPRQRLLFVVENLAIAQVLRSLTLARSLDPAHYEVHFACSHFDETLFAGTDFVRHTIYTIDRERAFAALVKGKRLYEKRVLEQYVDEEIALIRALRPALAIGDLRMSLAVSAPAARTPLATLINAFWSPDAARDAFPVPEHPIVKLVGIETAQRFFPKALPTAFAHFAAPVNALRKRHGLASLGSLPEVISFGDHVLFPDVPELAPVRVRHPHQRYIGPILWSSRLPLPPWWDQLDRERPLVHVSLEPGGPIDALPAVLEAVRDMPVNLSLCTAGRTPPRGLPANVHAAPLPLVEAAQRAALVICNGAESSSYRALAEGAPVIGIAWNFDQYLAMDAIERAGAGLTVRAGSVSADLVRAAVERVLAQPSFTERARDLAAAMQALSAREQFAAFLEEVLGAGAQHSAAAHARLPV